MAGDAGGAAAGGAGTELRDSWGLAEWVLGWDSYQGLPDGWAGCLRQQQKAWPSPLSRSRHNPGAQPRDEGTGIPAREEPSEQRLDGERIRGNCRLVYPAC